MKVQYQSRGCNAALCGRSSGESYLMPEEKEACVWKPTDSWRPCRTGTASGGSAVQCSETKDLGFAKPRDIHQEKIAADLAAKIGVPVPEVRLGQVEGHAQPLAVSVAFGKESSDLKR